MRNVAGKICRWIRIDILCSVTFFENPAVYEIMCKNIVERGRPQMTIWPMSIACWIPKAPPHKHAQKLSYLLLFHCNNGCTNASQCVVYTSVLPVMFMFISVHNYSNRWPNIAPVLLIEINLKIIRNHLMSDFLSIVKWDYKTCLMNKLYYHFIIVYVKKTEKYSHPIFFCIGTIGP
jgi:hypothetical protein